MNRDDDPPSARDAFREFALACRIERDRLARLRMKDEDRRFEFSLAERAAADLFAARVIAAAMR